jgi:hypothetical protein
MHGQLNSCVTYQALAARLQGPIWVASLHSDSVTVARAGRRRHPAGQPEPVAGERGACLPLPAERTDNAKRRRRVADHARPARSHGDDMAGGGARSERRHGEPWMILLYPWAVGDLIAARQYVCCFDI